MVVSSRPSKASGEAPLTERDIDRMFRALADKTRRDIVRTVLQSEQSVTRLSRRYAMSFAAVQKHVAALEHAGLVSKRRSGREQVVCARVSTIKTAARLLDDLEQLWRARVERIAEIVSEDNGSEADVF